MTKHTNPSKAYKALPKASREQYERLMGNKNVQVFVKGIATSLQLQENLNRILDKYLPATLFTNPYVAGSAKRLRHKLIALNKALETSLVIKEVKALTAIVAEQQEGAYHPYIVITNRDYTKYLSVLAMATPYPQSMVDIYTANGTLTDGSDLVDAVENIYNIYTRNCDPTSLTETSKGLDQVIDMVEEVFSVLSNANYITSVLEPSIDMLVFGTISKLNTGNKNVSMFMSPLLNAIVKKNGLIDDELFLKKGVFPSKVTSQDISQAYNKAMHLWWDMFNSIGLGDKMVYLDDRYYTVQFASAIINSIYANYYALFDKRAKASYSVYGFLPKRLRGTVQFTPYITHSASLKEADLGILGCCPVVDLDISSVHTATRMLPELLDVKAQAAARGHLVVSKMLGAQNGTIVELPLENYNCSSEEVQKYEAGIRAADAYKIVSKLNLSKTSYAGRYMDLTGRVYYKAPHSFYSPVENKSVRELVRTAQNVNHPAKVDFNAEFDNQNKLIWLRADFTKPENYLSERFSSITYQYFASFATVLGLKVSGAKDTQAVFNTVQEFFSEPLDGMSLADKSVYTNRAVIAKLWVFLKDSCKSFKYDAEVYAEAYKFLKVMFSELPKGTCTYTVAYDATSSVTQLVSLYCGEEGLMLGSNVIPSEDYVRDVYISITENFLMSKPEVLGKEFLSLSAAQRSDRLKEELPANRRIVKFAWMTLVYGSPVLFVKAYGEEGLKMFNEFISETYPKFAKFIRVFEGLWGNSDKYTYVGRNRLFGRIENYKAVMPDGFEFNYIPTKSVDIFCHPDFLKLKISVSQVGYDLKNPNIEYKDNKVRKASDRSFGANIIHSVDALIAHEVITLCEFLPQLHNFILGGLAASMYKGTPLYQIFDGLLAQAPNIDGYRMYDKEFLRKQYDAVRGNQTLFAMCQYVVDNKNKLMRALKQSRFVSAIWLIPFAGVALNYLGNLIYKDSSVFAELSKIADEFVSLMEESLVATFDENQKASSSETYMFLCNQFYNTVELLPKKSFSVTTIHDSFHVLPCYSEQLFNIVRLQYAKFAESDLIEYILKSFFGNDFVAKEHMNFLTHVEKYELSTRVMNSKFVVTF